MGMWIWIILIVTPGVWSGDWEVTLHNQCALKGSSVVLNCKYDYPFGNIVTSVSWLKAQLVSGRWGLISISELPSPPNHFKYIGNKRGDCNLKVSNVQASDEGPYYFSFVTTFNRWRSKNYALLSVRELTAAVQPSTVTEGGTVSLTCRSGCPEPQEVVWFKDGQRVSSPIFQTSREDAGRYHCAVRGQESVRSAPVVLSVLYAPKNVKLSVSPSGIIVTGNTVTLTCSSDAQPPVTQRGYSLYKDGEFISSGWRHVIPDTQPSQSGWYHCRAENSISWRGSDLMNSSEVHLDVLYPPRNVSVSVNPPHITEGSSVNLTCSSAANPAPDNYTWFKRSATLSPSSLVQMGSGQVLSLSSMGPTHVGLYLCHVRNTLGGSNSTEMMVAMAEQQHGSQPHPVFVVIGVSFVVMLGITLLLLWKKQKYNAGEKQVEFDSRLGVGASDSEGPSEAIYSNVPMFPSSPPLVSAQVPTSQEDEVFYTTVAIKPRNLNSSHNKNNRGSWLSEGEDGSVTYATVMKSS